jgi:hypothetical protein
LPIIIYSGEREKAFTVIAYNNLQRRKRKGTNEIMYKVVGKSELIDKKKKP